MGWVYGSLTIGLFGLNFKTRSRLARWLLGISRKNTVQRKECQVQSRREFRDQYLIRSISKNWVRRNTQNILERVSQKSEQNINIKCQLLFLRGWCEIFNKNWFQEPETLAVKVRWGWVGLNNSGYGWDGARLSGVILLALAMKSSAVLPANRYQAGQGTLISQQIASVTSCSYPVDCPSFWPLTSLDGVCNAFHFLKCSIMLLLLSPPSLLTAHSPQHLDWSCKIVVHHTLSWTFPWALHKPSGSSIYPRSMSWLSITNSLIL